MKAWLSRLALMHLSQQQLLHDSQLAVKGHEVLMIAGNASVPVKQAL